MISNNRLKPLEELALETLLENNQRNFLSLKEMMPEMLFGQCESKYFLKAISNRNSDLINEMLDQDLSLLVKACATITTASSNTYAKITPIQLIYILADTDLFSNTIYPQMSKLKQNEKNIIIEQFLQKEQEVNSGNIFPETYNFSIITDIITQDKNLRSYGKPSLVTEDVITEFKKKFASLNIRTGRSHIISLIKSAFQAHDLVLKSWNENQSSHYLIHIIGTLQCRLDECAKQEFNQGLTFYCNGINKKRSHSRTENSPKKKRTRYSNPMENPEEHLLNDIIHKPISHRQLFFNLDPIPNENINAMDIIGQMMHESSIMENNFAMNINESSQHRPVISPKSSPTKKSPVKHYNNNIDMEIEKKNQPPVLGTNCFIDICNGEISTKDSDISHAVRNVRLASYIEKKTLALNKMKEEMLALTLTNEDEDTCESMILNIKL